MLPVGGPDVDGVLADLTIGAAQSCSLQSCAVWRRTSILPDLFQAPFPGNQTAIIRADQGAIGSEQATGSRDIAAAEGIGLSRMAPGWSRRSPTWRRQVPTLAVQAVSCGSLLATS